MAEDDDEMQEALREIESLNVQKISLENDLEAARAQIPKWVTDVLPEDGKLVLTYDGAGIWDLTYLDNGYWAGGTPVEVWMPLPSPPKDSER